MEKKILTQGLPKPAVMESREPLPTARNLLPKPPEAQTPHQFATVVNQPTRRQRPVMKQQQQPAYNSPSPIPVPKSTYYHQRKRAAESSSEPDKRTYVRKQTFNVCKHCKLPKTVDYGHGRYVGDLGIDTFCPAVEGKEYPNKEAWVEARRKENPPKKKAKNA